MPQTEALELPDKPTAHSPKYSRLRRSDIALLLQMRKDGRTQTEIAQRLGCTQSAVSQWLTDLTDTTEQSKLYLRGQALKMSQDIVKKGRAADKVNVLKGLGVLEDQSATGLTIIVGGQNHDIRIGVVSPTSPAHTSESVPNP